MVRDLRLVVRNLHWGRIFLLQPFFRSIKLIVYVFPAAVRRYVEITTMAKYLCSLLFAYLQTEQQGEAMFTSLIPISPFLSHPVLKIWGIFTHAQLNKHPWDSLSRLLNNKGKTYQSRFIFALDHIYHCSRSFAGANIGEDHIKLGTMYTHQPPGQYRKTQKRHMTPACQTCLRMR